MSEYRTHSIQMNVGFRGRQSVVTITIRTEWHMPRDMSGEYSHNETLNIRRANTKRYTSSRGGCVGLQCGGNRIEKLGCRRRCRFGRFFT